MSDFDPDVGGSAQIPNRYSLQLAENIAKTIDFATAYSSNIEVKTAVFDLINAGNPLTPPQSSIVTTHGCLAKLLFILATSWRNPAETASSKFKLAD